MHGDVCLAILLLANNEVQVCSGEAAIQSVTARVDKVLIHDKIITLISQL